MYSENIRAAAAVSQSYQCVLFFPRQILSSFYKHLKDLIKGNRNLEWKILSACSKSPPENSKSVLRKPLGTEGGRTKYHVCCGDVKDAVK